MSQPDELRELVATLLMLTTNELGPETSLRSLDTSLGGAKLRLGLKRLGWIFPTGRFPSTLGQLEAALSRKQHVSSELVKMPFETARVTAPVNAMPVSNGVQIGLDIQDIRSLPVTDDYWEHDFYREIFDKSEIAYAVVQSEPRIHFAGFWCAKEALRKCDQSFIGVGMQSTVVAHDSLGKPYLARQTPDIPVRLPHEVSLSHTGDLAIAVVISLGLHAGSVSASDKRTFVRL